MKILFVLLLVAFLFVSGCTQPPTSFCGDDVCDDKEDWKTCPMDCEKPPKPTLEKCSDGTIEGTCSVDKPYLCKNQALIENCDLCGCNLGLCQAAGTCVTELCAEGIIQECGTALGVCAVGIQQCVNNEWGECVGVVGPSEEVCDELDNDCDGETDEGLNCECITNWECTGWSSCFAEQQIRICNDTTECGTNTGKPSETQTCASEGPICGNNNCENRETCSTCQADCGKCPIEPIEKCGDGVCDAKEQANPKLCPEDCEEPELQSNEKPIYILWLNHYKDHVNIGDDVKILNDLLDLFEENDLPVEWTMNGVLLQALRDGVKWPEGHGHSTDEWLFEPNPLLVERLQNARSEGAVFSSFSDIFMPYWGIDKIESGELNSFDDALALELERNTYYRDPVSDEMNKSKTGGQFKIFEELFGQGNAYTFHPTLEPQYEYATRIQGGQHFGSDNYNLGQITSEFEGPWFWYMGDMHYTFYSPDLLDGIIHWLPTAGTKHIDEDITAMKEYVNNSNTKYGAMYAGAHTHLIYQQGCMNAGEYDYDNPPNEKCELSPYKPEICQLGSYSIGSMGGNLIDSKYDSSCFQYLNSINKVPTDWFEMMKNPKSFPSLAVAKEGRQEEIYQRNFDYLTKFVRKLKQTADSDSQITIVTRETAKELVQTEEGREINRDTIYAIAVYLINNWEEERSPNFVSLKKSSSSLDGGSDYFTIGESYRLLHKSLTNYFREGSLPNSLENRFVLAPTSLNSKDDLKTELNAKFSIDDIIQTAVSISPINEYEDYQIDAVVSVDGREINPAEFLLLLAKANKELYEGKTTDSEIGFVGSKIITPFGSQKGGMGCSSSWCPYQSWTFKPAKFIG